VAGAEGEVAGVLAKDGGQEAGREIGVVGLVEEAAPGVLAIPSMPLPRAECSFKASAVREVRPRKMKEE